MSNFIVYNKLRKKLYSLSHLIRIPKTLKQKCRISERILFQEYMGRKQTKGSHPKCCGTTAHFKRVCKSLLKVDNKPKNIQDLGHQTRRVSSGASCNQFFSANVWKPLKRVSTTWHQQRRLPVFYKQPQGIPTLTRKSLKTKVSTGNPEDKKLRL